MFHRVYDLFNCQSSFSFSGELLHQDEKLEAVRELIKQVRREHATQKEPIRVHRSRVVLDVLAHFSKHDRKTARSILKVSFEGEEGMDEGGLSAEMFRLFFDSVILDEMGLFESSAHSEGEPADSANASMYLPKAGVEDKDELFRALGRAIVKCFYEGKRIGGRFAPSLYKYLAHGKE